MVIEYGRSRLLGRVLPIRRRVTPHENIHSWSSPVGLKVSTGFLTFLRKEGDESVLESGHSP